MVGEKSPLTLFILGEESPVKWDRLLFFIFTLFFFLWLKLLSSLVGIGELLQLEATKQKLEAYFSHKNKWAMGPLSMYSWWGKSERYIETELVSSFMRSTWWISCKLLRGIAWGNKLCLGLVYCRTAFIQDDNCICLLWIWAHYVHIAIKTCCRLWQSITFVLALLKPHTNRRDWGLSYSARLTFWKQNDNNSILRSR